MNSYSGKSQYQRLQRLQCTSFALLASNLVFNEHHEQTLIPAEFCFEPHNNGFFFPIVSLPLGADVVGAENQLLK